MILPATPRAAKVKAAMLLVTGLLAVAQLSAEQQGPTRVVQFNFQAFPLATTEEESP